MVAVKVDFYKLAKLKEGIKTNLENSSHILLFDTYVMSKEMLSHFIKSLYKISFISCHKQMIRKKNLKAEKSVHDIKYK